MDKNNFFKKNGLRPSEEQRLLTKPFYRNANAIYAHYDEWKDNDRFYFIPLYMEMTYCVAGIVSELAPDPVWLGSFVQSSPGQISSRLTYTWMRPAWSCSSMKEAAPMMRRDMMRPARHTSANFPFSGS